MEEKHRLVASWNGRTVLVDMPNDPATLYFSAVDDPVDFDEPTDEPIIVEKP